MFTGKNVFINERRPRHPRRASEYDRAIHRVFAPPKSLFVNRTLDQIWVRTYWTLRHAQFKIFYKDEETDLESISDLLKYEPPEKPPPMEILIEATRHQFSKEWLKYMYAKFKNECPTGRMEFSEFKRLFGIFVPYRLSDAYLERMFRAIGYNSFTRDKITFKDMVECIALLHSNEPKLNAQWIMRLIHGRSSDRVTLTEFQEFVKSVFLLVGREKHVRLRLDSNVSDLKDDDKALSTAVRYRSTTIFNELDISKKGYLTVHDFERFFSNKQNTQFLGFGNGVYF
jgi:Ca2+-binding EF-hand superfamily protein